MQPVIQKCSCASSYQDAKYGAGNRIFNVGGTKDSQTRTCTVCGKRVDKIKVK